MWTGCYDPFFFSIGPTLIYIYMEMLQITAVFDINWTFYSICVVTKKQMQVSPSEGINSWVIENFTAFPPKNCTVENCNMSALDPKARQPKLSRNS